MTNHWALALLNVSVESKRWVELKLWIFEAFPLTNTHISNPADYLLSHEST